jgi:hypothetical protein
MVTLRTARRIAPFLPLSLVDQSAWLSHVERYWQARMRAMQTAKEQVRDHAAALVRDMLNYRLSTFATDPRAVRRGWAVALSIGKAVAPHLATQARASVYLPYCDVMFDAYSMLGQHVEALTIAKRKRLVAALADDSPSQHALHVSREDLDRNTVNALRFEMVALTELGHYTAAYDISMEIEADPLYRRNARFWKPMLTWDRLNVMARLPRSSMLEGRRITLEAWRVCDKVADEWQPLAHMLVGRSYADLCITRGRVKEAYAVLKRYLPALDQTPHCGVFHKVLFLRAWARALHAQHAWDEWEQAIHTAAELAQQAGLANELASIEREWAAGRPASASRPGAAHAVLTPALDSL